MGLAGFAKFPENIYKLMSNNPDHTDDIDHIDLKLEGIPEAIPQDIPQVPQDIKNDAEQEATKETLSLENIKTLCKECQSPTDISCTLCHEKYHFSCIPKVKIWTKKPLQGDLFFLYECECNQNEMIKRMNLEWRDMIAIALFNSTSSRNVTEDGTSLI